MFRASRFSFRTSIAQSIMNFHVEAFLPSKCFVVTRTNLDTTLDHMAPDLKLIRKWKSKWLLVKNGCVHGIYSPPAFLPVPAMPITVGKYKEFVMSNRDATVLLAGITDRAITVTILSSQDAQPIVPARTFYEREDPLATVKVPLSSGTFATSFYAWVNEHYDSHIDKCNVFWLRQFGSCGIHSRLKMFARWEENDTKLSWDDPRWSTQNKKNFPQSLIHHEVLNEYMFVLSANVGSLELL